VAVFGDALFSASVLVPFSLKFKSLGCFLLFKIFYTESLLKWTGEVSMHWKSGRWRYWNWYELY
jgi:hypothetical protein